MWVTKWVNLFLLYKHNNNSTEFLDFTAEDMFTTKPNGLKFSCGRFLIKFLDNGKVTQVKKANNIWIHCFMNIITRLSNTNCMKEISDERKSSFRTNLGRVFYEIGNKGSKSIYIYPPNFLLSLKDNIENKRIKWKNVIDFYQKYNSLSSNSKSSSTLVLFSSMLSRMYLSMFIYC